MVACMRWSFGSAQLVSCCCVCFLDTAIIKPHLLALRRQLLIHIIQQSVWCSQPELMLYLVARTILAKALCIHATWNTSYSTRRMLRSSYFWPDRNSYARLRVFHTIFSTKRSHSYFFPKISVSNSCLPDS